MPREEPIGFDHTIVITAPPGKVLAAFFDARALASWWQVARAIANPAPLGAYALEWEASDAVDPVLGPLGGTFHGTVIDYKAGRAFFVAEAYWIPPRGTPIGPMSLEVSCAPPGWFPAVVETIRSHLPRPAAADQADTVGAPAVTSLHVVQRGYEESERWRRYYELLGSSLPAALERLKAYLEHGRGIWDLRGW
jgi:uncharacterized protein YndB with AHSA1/START domain